ncbi:hypothetical protein [Candidatus Bathycorpusculum sp.]|nr:hypothetical protein [Candidatus Termitimicrobium sp.]MCL2686139.1 hypothetical protein [Candidatus Termitimicrobium sp.]
MKPQTQTKTLPKNHSNPTPPNQITPNHTTNKNIISIGSKEVCSERI